MEKNAESPSPAPETPTSAVVELPPINESGKVPLMSAENSEHVPMLTPPPASNEALSLEKKYRWCLLGAAVVVLAFGLFAILKSSPEVDLPKRMAITFGLLLATVLVSTTTALAVTSLLKRRFGWLVSIVIVLAKAIAVFPVAALTWAFIGQWTGKWGFPIETMMPHGALMESISLHERLGLWIWQWVPAILLTALPLTAEFTAHLLDHWNRDPVRALVLGLRARGLQQSSVHYRHRLHASRTALLKKVLWLGWLGLLWLVPVEAILGIQGWGSAMARDLGSSARDADSVLALVAAGGFLGIAWSGLWWCVWNCVNDPASPRRLWRKTTPREAAIILGSTPREAWLKHEAGEWLKRMGARALAYASWAVLIVIWWKELVNLWPGTLVNRAGTQALETPQAPLIPGFFLMFCVLFFWILSRMLAPRSAPTTDHPHGKR